MGWFSRKDKPNKAKNSPVDIKKEVWSKCPQCGEIIWKKNLIEVDYVCTSCGYHFRLNFAEKLRFFTDENSFSEIFPDISCLDPLDFKDSLPYKKRIQKAISKTSQKSAFICGSAMINGISVAIGFLNFEFMGGSLGSAEGEKIARLIEHAIENKLPLIIVSSSGGARMQESIYSLMQMAKTSAMLAQLEKEGLPYISILLDPTTGGVTASFAMLGDINIAEPNALVGFAGARVIQQTIKQELPEGFQKSEFLMEHGMVDAIVKRKDFKDTLFKILGYVDGN